MSKKWIDKKKAANFEVVHRSREDALYYDEDAPQSVLVKAEDLNSKEQKQARKDKWITGPRLKDFDAADLRENEGEAALYGITFDDSKYDYMQHLRTIGENEDAVFIDGTKKTAPPVKPKGGLQFKDEIESQLPPEVLPQESNTPFSYQNQQGLQDSIAGLQPDMDPRLREVLEALDDEEFYEDGDDVDDLFNELTVNAEPVDKDEWEAQKPVETIDNLERKDGEQDWEFEFRKFKLDQKQMPKVADDASDVGSDFSSEFVPSEAGEAQDKLGDMPVTKPRKRRVGAKTDLSGFSMSSSANFRNKGLELLDARFDKVEQQYNEEEEEEEPGEFDMAKERPDLESIMDDFLENEVVFGKKLWKRGK